MTCPVPDCGKALPAAEVKVLVGDASFDKHKRLTAERIIDESGTIKYCPRVRCAAPQRVPKDGACVGTCGALLAPDLI